MHTPIDILLGKIFNDFFLVLERYWMILATGIDQ